MARMGTRLAQIPILFLELGMEFPLIVGEVIICGGGLAGDVVRGLRTLVGSLTSGEEAAHSEREGHEAEHSEFAKHGNLQKARVPATDRLRPQQFDGGMPSTIHDSIQMRLKIRGNPAAAADPASG